MEKNQARSVTNSKADRQWTRRKALATLSLGSLGLAAAGRYLGRTAFEAVFGDGVVKVISDFAGSVGNLVLPSERYELLKRCAFTSQGLYDIIGADAHDTALLHPRSGTYVNEEIAADALLAVCQAAPTIAVVPDVFAHHPGHSAVCLGSSKSSRTVMSLLGRITAPKFTFSGSDYQATFDYSILKIPGELVRVQDNKEHRTDRRTVVNASLDVVTEIQAHGTTLVSDALLMMRVPKRLSTGTEVIVFAGVHGPALRAVQLLLNIIELRDLEKLAAYARSYPYYQALFRVEGLDVRDGNTVADHISLMPDLLRPVRVRPV